MLLLAVLLPLLILMVRKFAFVGGGVAAWTRMVVHPPTMARAYWHYFVEIIVGGDLESESV